MVEADPPMTPYFDDGVFTLWNGRVEDVLPEVGTVFDLTVTSPPYNIGKEYDEPLSLVEYVAWCRVWMEQVYLASGPAATFWLNLGYTTLSDRGKAVPLSYLLWNQSHWYLQQEVVWHYGAGVAATRSFSPRNEKFLWFLKDPEGYTFNLDAVRDPDVKYPNQRKGGVLKVNPLGKNPSDVWVIPKVTSGRAAPERTPHPAQFPERVIERCILASSNEGDSVLDPFMGSGTTAVVAARHGRKVTGIEMREDYCEMAVHRYRARGQRL